MFWVQVIFLLIVALFLVPFGAIACWVSIADIFQGLQSLFWPRSQGTIKESSIEKETEKNSVRYRAKIVYDYSVSGSLYEADRISFKDSLSSREEIQRIIKKFPSGSTVMVRYHPRKPQLAVLRTGISIANVGMLVIGCGFLYFGCVSLKSSVTAIIEYLKGT